MVENPLKLLRNGAHSMNREKIIDFIKEEFKEGNIRNEMFPMMTQFGIRDYSETVHTVGLNYITAIGRNIEGITSLSISHLQTIEQYLNQIQQTLDLDDYQLLMNNIPTIKTFLGKVKIEIPKY
jgi:hypothetical protein